MSISVVKPSLTEPSVHVTSSSLCHDYWTHAPLSAQELETFLGGIGPEEVAVSITAKAGMRPEDYTEALERRWAAHPA